MSAEPAVAEQGEVIGPGSLQALADDILGLHREVVDAFRTTLQRWITVGEKLLEAKARVEKELGPGHWKEWVHDNLHDIKYRQVCRYVAAARDPEAFAGFTSLEKALEALNAPVCEDDLTPEMDHPSQKPRKPRAGTVRGRRLPVKPAKAEVGEPINTNKPRSEKAPTKPDERKFTMPSKQKRDTTVEDRVRDFIALEEDKVLAHYCELKRDEVNDPLAANRLVENLMAMRNLLNHVLARIERSNNGGGR